MKDQINMFVSHVCLHGVVGICKTDDCNGEYISYICTLNYDYSYFISSLMTTKM